MEEALLALLLADAGVASAVDDRIWWGRALQKDLASPYVVLTRIAGARDFHHGGDSGLDDAGVQVDVWADSYAAAKAAVRAIRTVVSGYRGGGLQGVAVESERDLTDQTADGRAVFRVSMDLDVWYRAE